MKKSKTRNKIFISCILFMYVFMLLFVIAIEAVTNGAFFESYAEAEIKEMQELYDIYSDLEYYYEKNINLFASLDFVNDDISNTFEYLEKATDEESSKKIDEMTNKLKEYVFNIDIYIVSKDTILKFYKENEKVYGEVKRYNSEEKIDFVREKDVFDFIKEQELYEESPTYYSSSAIIEKMEYDPEVYVLGVPRYDNVFSFTKNKLAIYNRFDQEMLRLNTETINESISARRIRKGITYKVFGIGNRKSVLCYYSTQDEQGEYCLGLMNDFDFSFRYVIYFSLVVFMAIVSIIFWYWSEKVTKPLDFFLMWIRLIKDKNTQEDEQEANMPIPKENYLLQSNIMLYFTFCLIPIIFAGAVQWYTENQVLNDYVEQRYVQSAEFSGDLLNEKYNNWRNPITMMADNKRIQEILEKTNDENITDQDNEYLHEYIHKYSNLIYNETDLISIYDTQGEVISSASYEIETDKYINYRINVDEDYKWTFAEEGLKRFVLHHKIYNSNDEVIGYIKLELSAPRVVIRNSRLSENLYYSYIYKYTDKVYNLLGMPNMSDEEVIDIIRNETDGVLIKSQVLDKANINYFYIVKDNIFFDKVWNEYVVSFLNLVFFFIIALVFAASILTRKTLNPIIQLSNALYTDSPNIPMSTLLLGKEEFELIVNRVKALSEQVNEYAREQKLLEAERHEHEKKRKDAEILTLQTQINPHFMYNIFSSIAVLIRTGETEKATKMVMHTGNLMRMGLYRGHVMIPLKEEMDHINQYINIQQIRYNNCMVVNMNVDYTLLNLKVVKFVLQPIVENAIEHNVGYLDNRDLVIDINAHIENDNLIIQISDNGVGMAEEEIRKLQESIDNFDMSNHLGLANINERIKLNCGKEYGVIIESNEESGLRVELVLPVVVEKEE